MKQKAQVPAVKNTAIAKFDITPEAVAELVKDVYTIKVKPGDTKSYKIARARLTQLVTVRTSIDKRRKHLGEEQRITLQNINKAGAMLTEPIPLAESHLRAELKTEDDRKKAIEAEKARVEQERVGKIGAKIESIRKRGYVTGQVSSDELRSRLQHMTAIAIAEADFHGFTEEAEAVRESTCENLKQAIADKAQQEKEDEERRIETERLEELRKERDIEEARLAKLQQRIREAAQAVRDEIEADKKVEEERKEREEFERVTKAQAEQDAKDKLAHEEKERIAAEKAEAEETARKEALRPDREKIIAYVESFYSMLASPPKCRDKKAKALLGTFQSSFCQLTESLKERAEDL